MDKISFDETKYIAPSPAAYYSRITGRPMLSAVLEYGVTPRQRQVLTLYFHERQTIPQIAARLGVNKSTVSRTLRRGLAHVRHYLQLYAESEKRKPEDG